MNQNQTESKPITSEQPDGKSLASSACSLLERDGWREYPDQSRKYSRCFYKRFDTPTRCRCNNKTGMQVCVAVSHHEKWWSYEIELHGEISDGTWIKIHNYGMQSDIEACLATIPRLLKTWEFIAANDQNQ